MTEVLLDAGITLDIATKDDIAAHHARLEGLLSRPHARYYTNPGSAESGAGTKPLIIDLGMPPGGLMWYLQWLAITGVDPFGAVIANVTAAAFKGAVPLTSALSLGPPVVGLDFASVIQTSMTVPSTTAMPDKSIIYSNEHLYVIFAGTGLVAGGARYRCVAGLLELEQRPDALMW